jgi:hypothetical protein
MAVTRARFDRAEERRLLDGWFATVAFDEEVGVEVPADRDDPDDDGVRAAAPLDELPAAEPDQLTIEEDRVSELTTGVRQRLGLADDADDATVLAALDALREQANARPEVDAEAVAAAAQAAEDAKAQAEAERVAAAAARDAMRSEIERLSTELSEIKAAAAADAKRSLFDRVVGEGRIAPADRESWERRYDQAPEVIAEVLASIATGTAVPVQAAGHTGPAGPDPASDDDLWEREFSKVFPPETASKGA